MKLQLILSKIADKLWNETFKFFGFDGLSYEKINARNDIKEIGTVYGGWAIPISVLDADSICYCVGCGEDISFNIGLIDQFDCDIFAFDPTPRAIDYGTKVAG